MRVFEIFWYYSDKKKFLFLFLCVFVLFIVRCAKIAPPTPLRSDYSETGGEVISNISVSGTIVVKQDSVGVQKFDKASWINLRFREEIDTTSGGIKVINAFGEEVPFTREWDVSSDVSELILKPGERLNYNTLYILKISGTEMYNLRGKHVDINKNGIVGEIIDDDFIFPFVTFKSDNSKGDWKDAALDKIPPFLLRSVKFLIGGKPTDYVWTDADLALYIYDYTWEAADTSIIAVAVDTATLDKGEFKIVEEKTGEQVDIKRIEYVDDKDTSDFGRVLINLSRNLEPESYYSLKVMGGISDSSGNKLGSVDSVVFEKRFKTFLCNYDSTQCIEDTTAPVVLNWRNIGPGFEVSFSELIAPASVTDSSVYIPELKGNLFLRNECGQTFVRFITSKRVSIIGYTAFVTDRVRDLSGNKIKEESYYFERKID